MRWPAAVLSAALVAAFSLSTQTDAPEKTYTPTPPAPGTCCYNVYTGCQPDSPIFGTCTLTCPCPTPTPAPAPPPDPWPRSTTGVLDWVPGNCNYIESPWISRLGDTVFVGGHAGLCCMMPQNDGVGQDRFWAAVYEPGKPGVFSARTLCGFVENDDHESGGYSPIIVNNRWFFVGARTERSYWGQGNRVRPFTILTDNPVCGHLDINRAPLFYPQDQACRQMGNGAPECAGSIGVGMHNSVFRINGRVLVVALDDAGAMNPIRNDLSGYVVYEIDTTRRTATFLYSTDFGPGFGTLTGRRLFPSLSDVAVGADGRLYGYTGESHGGEWLQSTKAVEWVSGDEGRTWTRTGRSWPAPAGNALWDIGVMRDGDGHLAEPLTLVGVTAPYGDWAAAGTWRLWYWTSDASRMPQELAGRRVRRRV